MLPVRKIKSGLFLLPLLFLASMFLSTKKAQAATCAELCGSGYAICLYNIPGAGSYYSYYFGGIRNCVHNLSVFPNASASNCVPDSPGAQGQRCACIEYWQCNSSIKPSGCTSVCPAPTPAPGTVPPGSTCQTHGDCQEPTAGCQDGKCYGVLHDRGNCQTMYLDEPNYTYHYCQTGLAWDEDDISPGYCCSESVVETQTCREYCTSLGVTPTPGATGGTPTPRPTDAFREGTNNSVCVGNTLPATVAPGQSFTGTVTVRNTGTAYWSGADGLGTLSPCPSATDCRWGSSGVALGTGVIVNQNTEHTFTLNLTAPAAPGTYDCFWKTVRGGVLFGEQCGKAITVAAACPWDLNHDGTVNSADVTAFNDSGCYQPLGSGGGSCSAYNFGGSAAVNALDYSLLLAHWGSCP